MKKCDLCRNITALKYTEVRKRNVVPLPYINGQRVSVFLMQSGIRIIAYRFS